MGSIVDLSQKWVEYIKTSENRVRMATSFIAGALVFLVTSAAVLAYEITISPPFPYFFFHVDFLRGVAAGAVAGLVTGVAIFMALSRHKNKELEELMGLIEKMGRGTEELNGTENALSVAEKILELLPKVVRRRTSDALVFGIAAFIVATALARVPIGVLVGVLVWLYFRYESNQSYDRHMAKLEEQRREFETEKKRFIESL